MISCCILLQAKDPLPKGMLSKVYPDGVLFVTYSLLVQKAQMGSEGRLAAACRSLKKKMKPPPKPAAGGRAAAGPSGLAGAGAVAGPSVLGGTGVVAGLPGVSRPSSGGESDEGEVQDRKKQTAAEKRAQEEMEALAVVAPDDAAEYAAKQLLRQQQPPGSRLWQIVDWLLGNEVGECMIILDECHRAKNLVSKAGSSTKTGLAIHALQNALPNARVLYSSATGASEPLNMAYMTRLLPPGFKDTFDMVGTLQVRGAGGALGRTAVWDKKLRLQRVGWGCVGHRGLTNSIGIHKRSLGCNLRKE